MNDTGIEKNEAIMVYMDNQRIIQMANSGRPTKMYKSTDIVYFTIQVWAKQDLLIFKRMSTMMIEQMLLQNI